MTNKLKDPAHHKERERPRPRPDQNGECKNDEWDADRMRQFVRRVLMIVLVVIHKTFTRQTTRPPKYEKVVSYTLLYQVSGFTYRLQAQDCPLNSATLSAFDFTISLAHILDIAPQSKGQTIA